MKCYLLQERIIHSISRLPINGTRVNDPYPKVSIAPPGTEPIDLPEISHEYTPEAIRNQCKSILVCGPASFRPRRRDAARMRPRKFPMHDNSTILAKPGIDEFTLALARLAREAGQIILNIRNQGYIVETKADKSLVTRADQEAEALILSGLARLVPDIPIIAEEEVAAGRVPRIGRHFFLVDPLDGTKDFVGGKPGFSVNIAWIDGDKSLHGALFAPALGRLFIGCPAGAFEWRNDDWIRLRVRAPAEDECVAIASASHEVSRTDDYLRRFGNIRKISMGSAVKFGLIAAGDADIYPRFGPTSEWDTAAGQCILEAAGGSVVTEDNSPLTYGHTARKFLNPHFIALGGIEL